MALRPLTGQRLAPAQGPATSLVVLVHGYGADGNDLISLAGHWRDILPNTEFVAPNAPDPVPGAPSGFQWFGLSNISPEETARGVVTAAPVLNGFLDGELARLGLGPDQLALVGFSQGTMLSLHVGLNRPVAAIVGFSGLLATPPPQSDALPPIFLGHGSADGVIPAAALFIAAGELAAAGARVQWHLAPGMGHGIDPDGLDIAGWMLAAAFAGRLGTQGPACCSLR